MYFLRVGWLVGMFSRWIQRRYFQAHSWCYMLLACHLLFLPHSSMSKFFIVIHGNIGNDCSREHNVPFLNGWGPSDLLREPLYACCFLTNHVFP